MRYVYFFILCTFLITILSLGTACSFSIGENKYKIDVSLPVGDSQNQRKPSYVNWKYEKDIPVPITGTIGKEEMIAGNLDKFNVEVVFPNGVLSENTGINIYNPDKVPLIDQNAFKPIGAPLIVSAGDGKPLRLNGPVTLKWNIPDVNKFLPDMNKNDIWITYYNGKEWEYLRPHHYDLERGIVYYETYHLSLFGFGKIDVEEKIEQYIHSKSVAETLQGNVIDSAINNLVSNAVEDLLLDKYGLDEDSVKYKVITSLANDDEYRDIIDGLANLDIPEVNKKLNIIIGKKIAENIGESALKSILENLTSDEGISYTEAAAQAAGHFAEGQYQEGIRIAGEAIADSFLITKLFKGAAEIVNYQANMWKDGEIEAAYKVFKNGADNGYWGYNVDAGRFDELWDQMRGIATKIQSDAVQAEIKRRKNLGLRAPTDKELDAIRNKAREDLRKLFEQRAKQEEKIEKEQSKLQKLIEAYKKNKLIFEVLNTSEHEIDIEHRLDNLLKIRDMIIADSGRKGWSTSPFSNEETVGIGDLLTLTRAWYSGKAEYEKALAKIFNIKKESISYTISIDPENLEGKVGEKYKFSAKAVNRPKNVKYEWFINGKLAQSGNKDYITPIFNKAGSFQIIVVMYDNEINKELSDAVATVTIKSDQAVITSSQSQSSNENIPTGGGTTSGTFPQSPFNGMQITYSISGGTISESSDTEGFTTSRVLKGKLGSGNLSVSGSAKMGNGYYADLIVRVTAGDQQKDFKAKIDSGYPGFNSESFNLSIPIPKDAKTASVSISMTGHYNAGTRGLTVDAYFNR